MTGRQDPLKLMDQAKDLVAMMTGVKAQFVAAGWSEQAAEQMVIELFRKTKSGHAVI